MNDFSAVQYSFRPNETVTSVNHGNDEGLYVEFRMDAIHNQAKSIEAGHAKFDDVPFITIMFPGDKTKKIDRPVKMDDDIDGPSDKTRFPRQWARFQAQEEQAADGLPVQQWPVLSKSQALELKAMSIHTVEQMAAIPDTALTWLGARELREQAKNWIEKGAKHAAEAKLIAQNTQLEEQVAALTKQVQELAEMAKKPGKTKE